MSNRKVRVGLAQEDTRRGNVLAAMQNVHDDLLTKLGEQILIKPNFFSSSNQLTATHVDAVRGVLDFLVFHDVHPGEVLIAEGGGENESGEAYRNYGYSALENEYDFPVRWLDLHLETDWVQEEVRLADGSVDEVSMPKTVLDHPCTISVAVAKTHDAGVVTLAVKNMIMGSLRQEDRIKIHGYHSHRERTLPHEAAVINANLFRISRYLTPEIAVIDGTVGIQGNGPGGKDTIELGVAVASGDAFAADAVMTRAMGFQPEDVGLLVYAQQFGLGITDLQEIEVIGPPLASVIRSFKPHDTHRLQVQWQNDAIASQLASSI